MLNGKLDDIKKELRSTQNAIQALDSNVRASLPLNEKIINPSQTEINIEKYPHISIQIQNRYLTRILVEVFDGADWIRLKRWFSNQAPTNFYLPGIEKIRITAAGNVIVVGRVSN